MDESFGHVPVMLEEILEVFAPVDDGVVVDATVGGGGHAKAILDAHDRVRLIGFDRDPAALNAAAKRLAAHSERVGLYHATFADFDERLDDLGVDEISGVLFDLGVSSHQLDEGNRGFSFRSEGPLDMRMDPNAPISAADLVNESDEATLASVLHEFGDERHARRIAKAIVAARPLETTTELARVISEAMPAASRRSPGHPARRSFQALRIAVNSELEMVERGIENAVGRLRPGGRGAVLSYHSGEDRIVKRRLRAAAGLDGVGVPGLPPPHPPSIRLLHRGGRTPTDAEIEANPRASAARLRSFERLEAPA